jgi:hypothetical protein
MGARRQVARPRTPSHQSSASTPRVQGAPTSRHDVVGKPTLDPLRCGPRSAATGCRARYGPSRRRNRIVTWLADNATVKWIVSVAAAGMLMAGCSGDDGSDEPGTASNGITLNTAPPVPRGQYLHSYMRIGGIVRVDANGCVYLEGRTPDVVQNVRWPAGYTATRQPDGTVTISNPDGVAVAATGHRLSADGTYLTSTSDIGLTCYAENTTESSVSITRLARDR